MSLDPTEVAILTIHGNSPLYGGDYALNYPWPSIQMDHLRRHTPPGFTVCAYGNNIMPEHEAFLRSCPEVQMWTSTMPLLRKLRNAWPARNWLIRQVHKKFRYLVMLDSDAFPIADGWLERYIGMLDDARPLVAVQRLEVGETHSDRCFMVFSAEGWRRHYFDFSPMGALDPGGNISAELEAEGLDWTRLNRTNRWNPHPLIAGIYDHTIYHHAAGTRLPNVRGNTHLRDNPETWTRELLLHQGLMHLLFSEPASFFARLEGVTPPLAEAQTLAQGREVVMLRPELFKRES
jgi:hypothetical protein